MFEYICEVGIDHNRATYLNIYPTSLLYVGKTNEKYSRCASGCMLYNGLVNYGITSISTTHNKIKTFVPTLWVDELYRIVHVENMGAKLL